MTERVIANIDLAALTHNFMRVKACAPQQSVLAMIKANAYGHGLIPVAKTLQDKADAFGLANIEEAMKLRQAGIHGRFVLMSGVQNPEELQIASEEQFELVVHHAYQLQLLRDTSLSKPITVWLKIDTGMHRLGIPLKEAHNFYQELQQIAWVKKPIYLMTHLAEADDLSRTTTKEQIQKFLTTTKDLTSPKCIANSAAILACSEAHGDWVRPGIMLYGISPLLNTTAEAYDLRPVMTLTSRLIAINQASAGDTVGYGCTWKCPEAMPIGVIGIGYGDGYPRHAVNGTPVVVNGIVCPLIGRVSMDMITVDLRPYPNAKLNDKVTLWGKGLPIEKIAQQAGTIAYELLCKVTQRVKFVY